MSETDGEKGLLGSVSDDGRPALLVAAVSLLVSGAFAIFLSIRREFLPHDIAYLGMSAADLCLVAGCRVVQFMFHDRVAFGGSLIAIAILYVWLVAVPLKHGEKWAWWAFAISGIVGFGSFLAFLGHGYFDTWHGVATLALLPVFIFGLFRSYQFAKVPQTGWLRSAEGRAAPRLLRWGRIGLLATGCGMFAAGAAILFLGTTEVFVNEDLDFMGVSREMLNQMNPRLVPVIAHDRTGFGGGLMTAGLLVFLCAWFGRPVRAFHEAVAIAGLTGFGFAIGTHFFEGYTNPVHLAPAFAGAALFTASLAAELAGTRWMKNRRA
jgi:hypothetical protein